MEPTLRLDRVLLREFLRFFVLDFDEVAFKTSAGAGSKEGGCTGSGIKDGSTTGMGTGISETAMDVRVVSFCRRELIRYFRIQHTL